MKLIFHRGHFKSSAQLGVFISGAPENIKFNVKPLKRFLSYWQKILEFWIFYVYLRAMLNEFIEASLKELIRIIKVHFHPFVYIIKIVLLEKNVILERWYRLKRTFLHYYSCHYTVLQENNFWHTQTMSVASSTYFRPLNLKISSIFLHHV